MAGKPDFDWYLPDWLAATETSQADLVRATGFPKAKVSELVNGVSRYNRDVINVISRALHIRPYELLLHPEDAHSIRRLLEIGVTIASVQLREPAEIQPSEPTVRKIRKKVSHPS